MRASRRVFKTRLPAAFFHASRDGSGDGSSPPASILTNAMSTLVSSTVSLVNRLAMVYTSARFSGRVPSPPPPASAAASVPSKRSRFPEVVVAPGTAFFSFESSASTKLDGSTL